MGCDIGVRGRVGKLVDEGFDVAVGGTTTDKVDQSLIARPLVDLEFYLVASPDYLKRTGRPLTLQDLNDHALLLYSYIPYHGGIMVGGSGGKELIKFKVVMESSNETMLYMAALEGMGLTFLPQPQAQADIDAGRLEIVLPDLLQLGGTLVAVYPSRKYLSAKVRLFIDFLVEQIRRLRREQEAPSKAA